MRLRLRRLFCPDPFPLAPLVMHAIQIRVDAGGVQSFAPASEIVSAGLSSAGTSLRAVISPATRKFLILLQRNKRFSDASEVMLWL
jgi:hypothetical protein